MKPADQSSSKKLATTILVDDKMGDDENGDSSAFCWSGNFPITKLGLADCCG